MLLVNYFIIEYIWHAAVCHTQVKDHVISAKYNKVVLKWREVSMQYNILTRVTSHHYRRIAYIIIFIGRNG